MLAQLDAEYSRTPRIDKILEFGQLVTNVISRIGQSKIRAFQGHSGHPKVDLNILTLLEVPLNGKELIFQTGSSKDYSSIASRGLIAGGTSNRRGRQACFFSDKKHCQHFTSRGSGCRGGQGGKLHHICVERANMFPSFSSFPPDSVPSAVFWIIFFGSILYHPKELSRIVGMSSESSTMLLVACVVPARRWVHAQRGVRNAGSKRWLPFFNGKRPFETFTPRSSGTGRSSTCRRAGSLATAGVGAG